jgi:alpha-glucosidase
MQLGAVSPIFRAHGYMADREPWSQGADALAAIRSAIVLRAQLLPSIATWTWQALRSGTPLARPMLLGPVGTEAGSVQAQLYRDDARWHDVHDQFFFGQLLAAPVLEQGATQRRVELPPGTWVDVWNGTSHAGGGAITIDVALDTLPLFVPAEVALVADPQPLAGRGRQWPPAELELWSWAAPGADAQALSYLDDGITRLHEQGAYCLQQLTMVDGAVTTQRLGGAWPASRVRAAVARPGQI